MPTEVAATREVITPSRGAKISVAIGIVLCAAALVVLAWPLQLMTKEGTMFGCGTGFSPPVEDFPRSVCGGISTHARLLSAFLVFVAVVVVSSGFWVFGTARRLQVARQLDDL